MTPSDAEAQSRPFLTTRWQVVLQAGEETAAPDAAAALEALCRAYWPPLYAHVRRMGYGPEDAADLTQAFFARLIENRGLGRADPARGRFRTFLLTALQHFVRDERDRAMTWKRGGRASLVPLDVAAAEGEYERAVAAPGPDERVYDRAWAHTVLALVRQRLLAEAEAGGRAELCAALLPAEGGEPEPYERLGARFGLSEGAVKLAAFRLRQRYRELIREEVAQTVATPAELEEELRHLLAVVAVSA
ncbi:MAG: sigma-70 family RNA polymerase sigma factor [Verrucomicrobia bacterium]|jgi:RNA polymerase sigma-70 factor (ECF subfamily)|nr:sigma-70 family RNA polymerase sigma factor [Verrucomicrobiota bacterium]